jgi:hypothetical protein
MINISRSRKILSDMQARFQEVDLPLMREKEEKGAGGIADSLSFKSWCKTESDLAQITASLFPEHDIIELSMSNQRRTPKPVWPALWDLFNLINRTQPYGYWVICSETGMTEYLSAMLVTGEELDRAQFRQLLERFVGYGSRLYALVEEQINSKKRPIDLLNRFMADNPDLPLVVWEESSKTKAQ